MVSWVFMPFNFNVVPFNWRQLASPLGVQEWLQAVSQRTSALVRTSEGLKRSTSRTWRSPFTSVIEVSPVELVVLIELHFQLYLMTFLWVYFSQRGNVIFLLSAYGGKKRYAPWNNVLWVLRQPCIVHFRWHGHVQNECFAFKHEKQSWFSAATLARCVGVRSLKDSHRQMEGWTLQRAQGNWSFLHSGKLY